MENDFRSSLLATKTAASTLATLTIQKRRTVLKTLNLLLEERKQQILEANADDVKEAIRNGKNNAFIDRLTFTDKNFDTMVEQVAAIAKAKEVLEKVLETKKIAGGVTLQKISVPLGVLGVIYESRPNVTIDVAALCLMSGNACVLKGGSDVFNTNKILVECVHDALNQHEIPVSVVNFLATKDRSIVDELVQQNDLIDVIIPRGGYELVKSIVEKSKVPILYHAAGGARIYVDQHANLNDAVKICLNSKTHRPATCNSLDTILVHEKVASQFIPQMVEEFKRAKVEVRGDAETQKLADVLEASDEDYATEFLDFIVAIKVVKSEEEALSFISKYSKRHTEGIVSEDKIVIAKFVRAVDAASVIVNCSTRLHDGGIYGLGAEMGIATGKLHARGPVGLNELTTYKWVAYGNGQIRN